MILADNIIKLRKQLGWSQEELAERMDVSRQSVSKWESTQSIPDLNKIIKLADIFGVSTDFLLKGETEIADFTETNVESSVNQISLEQSLEHINTKLSIASLTVKGIAFCVCSPAPLIFLLAVVNLEQFGLSPDIASTLGLVALLIMVAVGVSFFVRIKQYQDKVVSIEHGKFQLSCGVHAVLTEKLQSFYPHYNKRVSLGVAMFMVSLIPFLATAILSGSSFMTLLMLAFMFPMIAAGLFIILPASTEFETYKLLINEGDSGKSTYEKTAEQLGAFYWPLLVAIYLGWSLWTMNWGVTWIVFPVGAVAFAALTGLMGLLVKKEDAH